MNNPYNRPANSLVGLFIFLQQIAYRFFLHIFLQCLQNFPTEPTGFPTYTRAYTRTRTRTHAYAPAHAYTHENNIYTRDALTVSRDAVRSCRSSSFVFRSSHCACPLPALFLLFLSRALFLLSFSLFPLLLLLFRALSVSLFLSVRPLSLSLCVFRCVVSMFIPIKNKKRLYALISCVSLKISQSTGKRKAGRFLPCFSFRMLRFRLFR